jgi:CheY-like chemotaxis protein
MPARESHKILIVEDDPDVREVLQSFLTAEGYAAEGVANGQEALAHLRGATELPRLILLDSGAEHFSHDLLAQLGLDFGGQVLGQQGRWRDNLRRNAVAEEGRKLPVKPR